jgi:hypothetical protein
MRRTLGGVALLITAGCLPLLAACTGHGTGAVSVVPGAVTGSLLRVGGPAPGAPVPLPGQVVATSKAGARFTATVRGNGRYRLTLSPGTYQVTGHSPVVYSNGAQMLCTAARPVHITAGKTTSGVDVICSIS